MEEGASFISFVPSLFVLFAGVAVGWFFHKVIFRRLMGWALRTRWWGYELIIRSMQGFVIPFFGLIGLYAALQLSPLSPQAISVGQKVLIVLIISFATFSAANLFGNLVGLYGQKVKEALPTTTIFQNVTKITIFVLGGMIVLQTLGISITPLVTAMGIGGLAAALALQDTLSNLFSGIHILIARQIKVGDYIRLDTGEEGYVTDITWRNTTLRALPNNIHVIPNSKLSQAVITNYNLPQRELSVLVQVGVSYDSDLQKVERVTIEVAKEVMREVQGGVPEFEPFIRYHTFGDFSINFTVILRAKEFVDQYLIKHEFIKRLHRRYKEEGIEIPFPIRTIYMHESQ